MAFELAKLDLCNVAESNTVDEAFSNLHESILAVINKIGPFETFSPGKHKYRKDPWLPVGLLKSIKKQILLYKETLRANVSSETINKYCAYRNMLMKIKHHCKSQFYLNKCIEFRSNSKPLWKVINNITGKVSNKQQVVEYLKVDGIPHYDSVKITNTFNDHFSSVGRSYAYKN